MRGQIQITRWPAAALAVALLSSAGLAQGVLYRLEGEAYSDTLGYAACGAGDVNGDGYADILLAESINGNGIVRLRSGFDGSPIFEFQGAARGDSLGAAGDVNLDGFADFLVGSPWRTPMSSGNVRVFSGLDGSLIHTLSGSGNYDSFGNSVSRVGDVDGDGADDFLIGAPGDGAAGNAHGAASLYSGWSGSTLRAHFGTHQWNSVGSSVTGAGDLDSDGIDDYAIGAMGENVPGIPEAGALRIYSGASGVELRAYFGDTPWSSFGASADNIGDIDQDGTGDLMVGAPGFNADSGLARVFSGSDGRTLHTFTGDHSRLGFGSSVSGTGDVDGDGVPDMIVGGPADPTHTYDQPGQAQVYSGGDGSRLLSFVGDEPWEYFGFPVSGPGDVNADGVPDFLVGAPAWGPNWQSNYGRLMVYSGTCGTNRSYGSGCAGSGSVVPSLALTGCATPGGSLSLELTNGLGGALAFLILGPNAGLVPFRGCDLLVSPPAWFLPVALTGSGPGEGGFSFPVELPMHALPPQLAAQVLIRDPGGAAGLSASNGVGFTIP